MNQILQESNATGKHLEVCAFIWKVPQYMQLLDFWARISIYFKNHIVYANILFFCNILNMLFYFCCLSLCVSGIKMPELENPVDNKEEDITNIEFKTPTKTHAMFAGTCNMGMSLFIDWIFISSCLSNLKYIFQVHVCFDLFSIYPLSIFFVADKDDSNSMEYINSSSIQCAQRETRNISQTKPVSNLMKNLSPFSETPELSSQSRIQSYNNKETNEAVEDIDDFEVCRQI